MVGGEKEEEEEGYKYYWRAKPLVYLVWVVRKLREEGLSIKELVKKFNDDWGKDEQLRKMLGHREPRKDTVRDYVKKALYALKDAGFAGRREGKWMIYWYRFGSKKEHHRYLYKLMEVCIHKTGSVWPLVYSSDEDMRPKDRRITIRTLKRLPAGVKRHTLRACEKLVEELRREYPHIYEQWKELRRAVKEEQESYNEFLNEVNRIVRDRGFEIVEYAKQLKEGGRQILAYPLYETIMQYLKHSGQVPIRLGFEGNKITVVSPSTSPSTIVGFPVLAKGKELKGEIEEMFNEIIGSEKVKEAWNNLKKAEKNTDKEGKKLKKMLEDLWFDISIYLSTTTPSKSCLNN